MLFSFGKSLKKNTISSKMILALTFMFYGGIVGCSPMVSYHGFNAADELSKSAQEHSLSKQEILRRFGPPSVEETKAGTEYAYYVSYKKEKTAFFTPEITDRKVIELAFEQDILKYVKQYKLKDGYIVDIADETTPIYGKDLNMIQQILSNVGRFNSMSNQSGNDGSVIGRIPGGL